MRRADEGWVPLFERLLKKAFQTGTCRCLPCAAGHVGGVMHLDALGVCGWVRVTVHDDMGSVVELTELGQALALELRLQGRDPVV